MKKRTKRTKPAARPRSRGKGASAKKSSGSRPKAAARRPKRRRKSPAKSAPVRSRKASTAERSVAPAAVDPAREIRRLQTARRNLERQLTAAVQEIGILRQWEVRARMLESELEKRNERLRELEERLGGADLVRQPRLL